jgi:heme/copper-type cytochrome/quinol oxidase subunit 3
VSEQALDPRLAAQLPELAPPPPPPRPRVLLIGSAMSAAAFAMAILALVAVYLSSRADAIARLGSWLPEDAIIPLSPANMSLFTLLMSMVTIHWAAAALRDGDRVHAYLALGVTALFGAAVINGTYYLYTQTGLVVADSPQAVMIFGITGLHLAMLIAAMLFTAAMAFHALGGQLTGRSAEGMSAAVLFWDVMVGVYAVVWYAIYIVK